MACFICTHSLSRGELYFRDDKGPMIGGFPDSKDGSLNYTCMEIGRFASSSETKRISINSKYMLLVPGAPGGAPDHIRTHVGNHTASGA